MKQRNKEMDELTDKIKGEKGNENKQMMKSKA